MRVGAEARPDVLDLSATPAVVFRFRPERAVPPLRSRPNSLRPNYLRSRVSVKLRPPAPAVLRLSTCERTVVSARIRAPAVSAPAGEAVKTPRKSPPRADATSVPYARARRAPGDAPTLLPAPPLPKAAIIGPLVLFLVACAFGVLEVHGSNDTWIALAAGRQIVEQVNILDLRGTFPRNDTFSYTFEGKLWFNQNWLSHLYLWLLYDKLGPNWVIYGTWAVASGIFLLVAIAARLRSGSWLAGLYAGAAVGVASRDWLSARPATMQFFLFAALWLLLSALLSQGERRRWWPIAALFPVMLVWGGAHGSFVLGYALIALFLAAWACGRFGDAQWFRILATTVGGLVVLAALVGLAMRSGGVAEWARLSRRLVELTGFGLLLVGVWGAARYAGLRGTPLRDGQVVAIVGVTVLAVLVTIWLGPFGLDNFLHPLKVTESEVFREVSEWVSPLRRASFPPVTRFWLVLGAAVALPLAVLVLRFAATATGRTADSPGPPPAQQHTIHSVIFDVCGAAVGLFAALFARRFAPMLHIFAAPALAAAIVSWSRPLAPTLRLRAAEALTLAALPLALGVGGLTFILVERELVAPYAAAPETILLHRVTRLDGIPTAGMHFLRENDLRPRVYTEWTWAGTMMFWVPGSKQYIDGRAQQVYDEAHYVLNARLSAARRDDAQLVLGEFDRTGTDAVFLSNGGGQEIFRILEAAEGWVRVYSEPRAAIYLRVGGAPLETLGRRLREGTAWWPDTAESDVFRALVLLATEPRDLAAAEFCFRRALERDLVGGRGAMMGMVGLAGVTGKWDETAALLSAQRQRIAEYAGMDSQTRQWMLNEVLRCEQRLAQLRQRQGG